MTPPPCTYFSHRGELFCAWQDGSLAQLVTHEITTPGRSGYEERWEAVRGPDYDVIRAELTHPEETVPVADQPSPDDHTLVWDGKPWQCRCPTCRPK